MALGLVAALACAGQVVVQRALASQLSSAEVINIAGRQRMLSQRLTKNALLSVPGAGDGDGMVAARARLAVDLAQWEAAHERLARDDLATPDLAVVTAETRSKIQSVELAKEALAHALRDPPLGPEDADAHVRQLLAAERRYLILMDDLVFAYSRIAEARTAETRRTEGWLLAMTLLVLLLEAMFVFRPMQGALERAATTLGDIIERLRASEGRYARAMAGARDGFWDWNLETRELGVSERFCELLGLPIRDEPTWADVITRLSASDRPALEAWVDGGAKDELDVEVRVRRGQTWRWLRMRGAPSPEGTFASGRLSDVDERRRLLAERERTIVVQGAQLQDAGEALQRSSTMNAVATLAGGLAHDFNNYLQVISLETEWLEKRANEETAVAVTSVRRAADEAAGLAHQLLSLTRGKVGTTLAPVEVTPLLKEMDPLLARLVGKDHRLAFFLEEKVPLIDADAGQLRQLLVNLVANASDAMAPGGELRVEARSSQRGAAAGVEIAVVDEGHGMSDDVRRRVFEPFFTTKTLGKGTGLGLAMVHGIVERHRGHIDIESAEGEGTVVRVWFPAREAAHALSTANVEGSPLDIMLVDDDPAIRNALKRQLIADGHDVTIAGTGEQAVALAGELASLDLLITDVMLPGMLGPEVADKIRHRFGFGLPVLFISGYASENVDLGAENTRLLVKPFSVDDLSRELQHIHPESP